MQHGKMPNRFIVDFDGFRKLTRRERLKILFGWNLHTKTTVLVDRRNHVTPVKGRCDVSLTKERDAEGQVKEHITECKPQ